MSSSTLLLMNLRSIHFPVLRQTFWGKTIFNLACTFKKDSFGFSTSLSSACFSQYKRGQRKNRHIWALATKNLDTAISGELESKETTHKVKKKVALWLGYVGSDFKGLQSQKTSGCQQNAIGMAIEDELEKAIYRSGGILESNYGNLHKVSWVRSSRTDKGVHSLSTVISMKMEVPYGTWTSDPDGTSLVDSVNLFLPSSIRVFSIVPVNKSFDARWSCYSRTYSYLLPAAILGINQSTSINERKERIEKLQTILRLFEVI
ncbi:hypothetical protein O6H91_02G049700 [Diphasiastrum complanatum]|uniref:Uncharacterized protein n=1 Tax=Diphasiastrum complanatum TaxID=34168 RepID=A0ACC2EF17_DIPCM|nr:hypothetical protein O6H91_02G049700 [Diphasiastrum complanatum]